MNIFEQLQQREKPVGLEEGLEEFAKVYMPARNYTQRTRQEYGRHIQDLSQFLKNEKGIQTWTVVGLRDLQHYLAELDRRGLKASSRYLKTHAIKTFFSQFLYQSGYLNQDPAKGLIPPTVPRKEPRFLTEAEYRTLRAQTDNTRDRAIVEIFLQTGIRLSELARLTLDNLELPEQLTKEPNDVGLLKVRRREMREVVLPLNWRANKALLEWLDERKEIVDGDLVLASNALFLSRVRRPLTPKAIRNMIKKYLAQAGIRNASVHTLRHTMAIHYLARGGDLKSVQKMLGHESAKTTRVYLDLAKKVQRRMVQELGL